METRSLDSPATDAFAGTQRTFKRGHIRRSSYESAEIQLHFTRRHDPRPPLVNRASFEEALSSLHSAAEEEKAVDCGLSCTSTDTGLTPDSAVGESVSSKRSSLDRRSEASVTDWEEQQETSTLSGGTLTLEDSIDSSAHSCLSASSAASPCSQSASRRRINIPSINFPSCLPAKPTAEATHHRALHQEVIQQAKKKEARAEKERKRQILVQHRLEEQAMSANRLWNETILPKWEEMKNTKRCRELWWQGIPSSVRGRVWSLAIQNDLKITPKLYEIHCQKAEKKLTEGPKEREECSKDETIVGNREDSVAQIHLDVSRTFPALGIFQQDGPYNHSLQLMLAAYVCYRPDVGYVQSMSFLAAVLLLQMEPFPAFVAFSNLLNRPLQLAFFRLQQPEMTEYFIAFDRYFEQELKDLHARFDEIDVRPDIYLIEWVYTMFAKSLPLDVTCRVWDVFLRDGEEFLFKAALGILRMYEKQLLCFEFDEAVHFLTHLPETLCGAELFRNIEPLMRSYPVNSETARSKKRFFEILAEVKERINPSRSEASPASSPTDSSSQISASLQSMKMSKSLSGFISDLLKSSTE